ncbi:DUF4194 domain-containing protein [Lachnoclostridium sp. Marseille-P6806]|uniref:DUF4194 domain-containing protein n=1 Tax=Lachnoclostridium sp. Marseille-P6806 TaxID=2364793 RepID=UPI001030DB27|nr:DUF4194 domain-containing protein [Lachnoclostridium sp. Marseille-P6806]
MFEEKYEKLNMTDKENFRRLVNYLLGHSFLVSADFDFEDSIRRSNPDYLFMERHFELFEEYLSFAGFHLIRDTGYGVIALSSEYEYNHYKFDKMTTLFIYCLRLIYEEEREKLSLAQEVFTTTGELVHKLLSVNAVSRKPANVQIRNSLRTMARFQIISKVDGLWESADTRILIRPTILFIVSNERIGNMHKLIEDDTDGVDAGEPGTVEEEIEPENEDVTEGEGE